MQGGGGAHAVPGSPAGRVENWQTSLMARPQVIAEAYRRKIAAARSLEELAALAEEFAAVQKSLVELGVIRKPPAGDAEIKDLLKSIVTDQLESEIHQLIFSTAWDAVQDGIEKALFESIQSALWMVFTEIIKKRLGELAKEIAEAIKERKYASVGKILYEGLAALAKSLSDQDGLVRGTLRELGRRGVVANDKAVRKVLQAFFKRLLAWTDAAKGAFKRLLKSPLLIAVRLLLTPSNTVDDKGELYYWFRQVQDELNAKIWSLLPELPPPSATDRLKLPSQGSSLRPG